MKRGWALTCLERLDDSENALIHGFIRYFLVLAVQYVPLAVFTLERFQTHVRSPMYRKSSGYGKSLSAARDIAQIGFWAGISRKSGTKKICYTLSCVWRRMCCCSVAASEKCCLQSLHWNGLCPVCICRTSVTLNVEKKRRKRMRTCKCRHTFCLLENPFSPLRSQLLQKHS